MSNIVKNYFKVLEVISSLNCGSAFKPKAGRSGKMSDLEVVALSLSHTQFWKDVEDGLKEAFSSDKNPGYKKK